MTAAGDALLAPDRHHCAHGEVMYSVAAVTVLIERITVVAIGAAFVPAVNVVRARHSVERSPRATGARFRACALEMALVDTMSPAILVRWTCGVLGRGSSLAR